MRGRAGPDRGGGQRLDSWKEIASFFNKGVSTVRRWEREEKLPVHRHEHGSLGSVYAYRSELEAWRRGRERGPERNSPSPPGGPNFQARVAALTALCLALVAALLATKWTPDENAPGPMKVIPLATDPSHESSPALSPDGTLIVYSGGSSGTFRMHLRPVAGGNPRPLTTGPAFGSKWSPDGKRIAFYRWAAPGVPRVYLLELDDGTETQLPGRVHGTYLGWSPDSRSLCTLSMISGRESPFAIHNVDVSTGQATRLTSPPAGSYGDTQCAFSPDGRLLAFARRPTREEADLYVQPLTGGAPRRLTWDDRPLTGMEWTPNSREIVFGSGREGNTSLWRIRADGLGRPRFVAAAEGDVSGVTISRRPAPVRLAYAYRRADENVWRWDPAATAGDRNRQVAASTLSDDDPAISPDGTRIAFQSNRSGASELWVAAADGSNPVRVTNIGKGSLRAPDWSPDNRRIAFTAISNGKRAIHVVAIPEGSPRRLTTDAFEEGSPSWSRDGRWIYYRSNRSGRNQIWKVDAAGGSPISVTKGGGFEGREAADSKFYFTRAPWAAGVWRVSGNGGEETLAWTGIHSRYWGLADRGLYFIDYVSNPRSLMLASFGDPVPKLVDQLPTDIFRLQPGFSVSRDGQSVLWTNSKDLPGDVMLIEDLR